MHGDVFMARLRVFTLVNGRVPTTTSRTCACGVVLCACNTLRSNDHLIIHFNTFSQNIEEQWEAEMKRLEEERLQALQREEELKKMVEDDEVVQNLDKELQTLIMVRM